MVEFPEPDLPPWMDPRRAADIARLRALGFTQEQIAGRLGISQQTVSRYLRGLRAEAESRDDAGEFLMGLLLIGLGAAAAVALFKMLSPD